MEKDGIWQTTFNIPAFMVNNRQEASLTTICNLLQEVAGQHALYHKLGYEDMLAKDQFWVLNRLRVKMKNFPKWRSNINIQTWVNNMKGPFSYRNFAILNADNELMGSACSLWVLLDAKTRRPVRIAEHGLPILEDKKSLCGEPDKLVVISDEQLIGKHRVKHSDLDMINHVNNSKYVEWLLDLIGDDKKSVNQIDINYLQESFLNDEIEFYANENNYALRKIGNTNDLCRIRVL